LESLSRWGLVAGARWSVSGKGLLRRQQAPLHLRDRRLARKALADVERRAAVDEILAGEQGHVVSGPERDDRVRIEAGQRGPGDLVVRAADHGELARRRQVEVEPGERMAEGA